MNLRGVSFEWKDKKLDGPKPSSRNKNSRRHYGLIAQEVEPVVPEVVSTAEDGHKSVAYDNLVAVLVEAIKEQQQKIDHLKARLADLENQK